MERCHWNLGPRLARKNAARLRRKKRLCHLSDGRSNVRTDRGRRAPIPRNNCRSLPECGPNCAGLVELRVEQRIRSGRFSREQIDGIERAVHDGGRMEIGIAPNLFPLKAGTNYGCAAESISSWPRTQPTDSQFTGADIWIVDYKTGSRKSLTPPGRTPEAQAANLRKKLVRGDAIQLGLYGLAVRELGAAEIRLSILSLRTELDRTQLEWTLSLRIRSFGPTLSNAGNRNLWTAWPDSK